MKKADGLEEALKNKEEEAAEKTDNIAELLAEKEKLQKTVEDLKNMLDEINIEISVYGQHPYTSIYYQNQR